MASIRVASLERIALFVHELAHANWDALNGDVSAVGRIDRHRARLRAALDGVDTKLPSCEVVAAGTETFSPAFANAVAELEGAIARERAEVAVGA
jgi:hypothetical protein